MANEILLNNNGNSQYGIKEVMNFTICEYNKDPRKAKPLIRVDYAQVTSLNQSADRIDVHGGWGNPKLISFDHTKMSSGTFTLPLVDPKVVAMITGDGIKHQIAEIFKYEAHLVESGGKNNYIVLEKEPLDNALFVNVLNARELDTPLQVMPRNTDDLKEGECSIKIVGKEVRLYVNAQTCPLGTEISANYTYQSKKAIPIMRFSGEKFPKAVTIKGTAIFKDQVTDEEKFFSFIGYKCKFQTNFTFNMSATDPTVLELNVDFYAHKDRKDQEMVYWDFMPEEDDDSVVGNITFNNLPKSAKDGILKLGHNKTLTLGIDQENVEITEKDNSDVVTIEKNKITTKGTNGKALLTFSKYGYEKLTLQVVVNSKYNNNNIEDGKDYEILDEDFDENVKALSESDDDDNLSDKSISTLEEKVEGKEIKKEKK